MTAADLDPIILAHELDSAWEAEAAQRRALEGIRKSARSKDQALLRMRPAYDAFERITGHVHRWMNGAAVEVVMQDIKADVQRARTEAERVAAEQK